MPKQTIMDVMNASTQTIEKIYRVWSSRKEDQIAVRVAYSISDQDECRVFDISRREEW